MLAARVDPFHWNLGKSVVTEFCGLYKSFADVAQPSSSVNDIDAVLQPDLNTEDDVQPIGQNSACHDRINAAPKPGSIDNEDIHAIIPKLSSPDSQNDTSTSDKPPMNSSTDAEPMIKFDYEVG